MEDLLTIEQASKFLALHPKTLRKEIINKGLLPVIAIGKGARGDRIDPKDLRAFIGERLCYYNKVKSGTQNSSTTAKRLNELLGRPTKRKPKK